MMLLIDWLEAVDYHGPLVTRYLMMRGERREEEEGWAGVGVGVGKEGWKLDEPALTSTTSRQLLFFFLLSDFCVYYAVACVKKKRIITTKKKIGICAVVRPVDVRSQPGTRIHARTRSQAGVC